MIKDGGGVVEYPYGDPDGSHPYENRCKYALTIDSVENFGSGKHVFPRGLWCMLFQTAVYVSDDSEFANHGDQCHVHGRTAFYFCDIGFHCNQEQAFFWTFHHIDTGYCTWPLLYDRGGKLFVNLLDIARKCRVGLYIRGNDSGGVGPGIFILNYVNIDELAENNVLVLRVEPATGASAARTYINTLHINNTRATAGWGVADYSETGGTLNASTGQFLTDDMEVDKVDVGDYAFIRPDGDPSPKS